MCDVYFVGCRNFERIEYVLVCFFVLLEASKFGYFQAANKL